MAVKVLQRFGALRRVFRGSGSIGLSDGSSFRARFTLGQLTNTRLLICANLDHSPLNFQSSRLEIESLQGTLTDGHKISATDLWIKEVQRALFAKKARLIIPAGYWTISGSAINGQVSVVFELVNFLFLGTEPELRIIDGLEYGTRVMTLFLGDRQAQLRPTTDYNQAVAELKARSGVRVTCTATTVINSQSDINDATSMMDTLCSIMSVARGTLVSWTSFEVRSADGVLLYSQYRNSVTRRYTGIELIDNDDCERTKRFLEDGFRKCEGLAEYFKIMAIAHDFIETRDGAFIENRSLRIAVLVEYLANVRAMVEERTHFLQPKAFDEGWKSFEAMAKSALMEIYPDIGKKYLPLMLGNMKGVNRRPLKFKIERLATWLGISFSSGEIDKFIRTRDLLAHENSFPDNEEPREHYKRMQHFLDRIILRLFDYHGPYYDFEHGEIRQI